MCYHLLKRLPEIAYVKKNICNNCYFIKLHTQQIFNIYCSSGEQIKIEKYPSNKIDENITSIPQFARIEHISYGFIYSLAEEDQLRMLSFRFSSIFCDYEIRNQDVDFNINVSLNTF